MLAHPQLGLLSPLFSYAQRLAELKIDETEAAIMAATWILQVYSFFFMYCCINCYNILFFAIRLNVKFSHLDLI